MDEAETRAALLGKLHDSLYDSYRSAGHVDTILVASTYVFNLVMLFLLFLAKKQSYVFAVFLIGLVLVNLLILATFRNSRDLRWQLHSRQAELYKDAGLSKYIDESIVEHYKRRYAIWVTLDITLGVMVLLAAVLMKT